MWTIFADIGYWGSLVVLDSTDFGLPQRRQRVFIVLLNANNLSITPTECVDLSQKILATTQNFKKKAPGLCDFLLDNDDIIVRQELARRKDQKEAPSKGGGGGAKEVGWPQMHRDFLAKKGLTRGLVVTPPEIRASEWFSTLGGREQECLGFAVRFSADKGWTLSTVNLAPSINMITFGRNNIAPTLVPGNLTWLFNPKGQQGHTGDRLLLGHETLALQGYPVRDVLERATSYTPSDVLLKDLGGNAFAMPIVQSIFVAIYINVKLPKQKNKLNIKNALADMLHLMDDSD